jgi:hypothetical protein
VSQTTDEVACPKCGRARAAGAGACARCGLVYARWRAAAPEAGAGAASAPLDDLAAALWAGVQASWDDAGLHDRFVQHCAATGQLAAAGRVYRAVLDRGGDGAAKGAIAQRMQQRIVVMASFALGSAPAARRVRPSITRSPWFLVVVGLALLTGTLGGLLYAR